MKQLLKLGYSGEQAAEFSAYLERAEGLSLIAGPQGTKTEKMFRVFQDAGLNVFLNDIGKAVAAEGPAWLFETIAPAQALVMIERAGARISALFSRRKIPLLCQSCAVPYNPEKRAPRDRCDDELLFGTFPGTDFSGAKMPADGKCPDCGKSGEGIICEMAIFDGPVSRQDALSFGQANPSKSMAAQAARLCGKGLCDPAQAARAGGLLLWKR